MLSRSNSGFTLFVWVFCMFRDFPLETFLYRSPILIWGQKGHLQTVWPFQRRDNPTTDSFNHPLPESTHIRLACVSQSMGYLHGLVVVFHHIKSTLPKSVSSVKSGLVAEGWSAHQTCKSVFPKLTHMESSWKTGWKTFWVHFRR